MYYIGKLGKRNDGEPLTASIIIFVIAAIPTFLYVMYVWGSRPYNPNDFLMRFSWWRTHDLAVLILKEVIALAVLFAVVFFVVNITGGFEKVYIIKHMVSHAISEMACT